MDGNWLKLTLLAAATAMSVAAALSVPACVVAFPFLSAGHALARVYAYKACFETNSRNTPLA